MLMKTKLITWLVLSVLISGGAILLHWWLGTNPVTHLVESVPGMDGRPALKSVGELIVKIGEFGRTFDTSSPIHAEGKTLAG